MEKAKFGVVGMGVMGSNSGVEYPASGIPGGCFQPHRNQNY